MKKILNIALNDLRVNFRDPSFFVFLLLIPAVLIVVVAFANGAFATTNTEPQKVLVDVVDLDQSELSTQLLASLRGLDANLVLCPMDNTTDDLCRLDETDQRLENGVVRAYLEIPAGFGEALLNDQTTTLIYRADEDITQVSTIYQNVQTAAQRVSSAIIARRVGSSVAESLLDDDPEFANHVYERALAIWATNPVSVAYSQAPAVETSALAQPGFRQSVPGLGSMYVMFTVLSGAIVLILERKQWTLQRLITMPVTGSQVIAGKMLARFVLGMLQYGVAFGVGLFFAQILGFNFGNSPVALILVMMAFTLCMCAVALLLATIAETDQQAAGWMTFIALTLAPIGGAWWSLDFEFVPEFMRQISYLSPLRYAMIGFNSVIYEGGGIVDVLPLVGILLAIGAVLFVLAVRRFKYE